MVYFAYGSNMSFDQMKERCPNSAYLGNGYLKDYKLDFTRMSQKREGGVADIVYSENDEVWGVFYSLTNDDLETLDRYEGYPDIYTRNNFTCNIINNNLNEGNTEQLTAIVYSVVNKSPNTISPSLSYLKLLLDAAFEYSFPIGYQKLLYKFGINNYNEKLEKAIDTFLHYQSILINGDYLKKIKNQEEWGGANLVITGDEARKDQLNKDYPSDLVVLTPHFRELSWLVNTLYYDESIAWQVDSSNKHYILHELGLAALEYLENNLTDANPNDICLAVLYKAYKIFTIDFYKMY
jgi:hypothetical protein